MKNTDRYIMEAPAEAQTAIAILRCNTETGSAFNVTAFKGKPSQVDIVQMLAASLACHLQVMAETSKDVYDVTLVAALEHHLCGLDRLHTIVGAILHHKQQVDDMLESGMIPTEIVEAIQQGGDFDEE